MNEPMTSTDPLFATSNQQSIYSLPLLEPSSIYSKQQSSEEYTSELAVPSLEIDCIAIEDPRIIEMREENQKLRQLAQYLSNYNGSLKKLIELDYSRPSSKRDLLEKLVKEYGLSRRHVCRLLNLARSTCWYRSTAKAIDLPGLDSGDLNYVSETEFSLGVAQ